MSKYSEQIKSFGDGYLLQARNSNRLFYKLLKGFSWFCIIVSIPCLIYGINSIANDYGADFFIGISLLFLAVAGAFWYFAKISKEGVHEINVELARRGLEQYIEENYQQDSKTALKWGVILLIAVIVVGVTIGIISNVSGNNKCTICEEPATHTFQGSGYCTKHYHDATKWVIDNFD